MPHSPADPRDVWAIEQLLVGQPLADGRLVVREPSLIRVDGTRATARHYVLEYDLSRARLASLRYATWLLHRGPDGRWAVVDASEVAAGDARVSDFLNDGLAADFAAVHSAAGPGRMRSATDGDAIRAVLAGYGLAADAGDADLVGALYTADAVVDISGDRVYRGRKAMSDMIRGEFHRALLPWAGHTMGPSLVAVDCDRAQSLHLGRTYGPPPRSVDDIAHWDRRPFRYSVNRWTFVRGGGATWQVATRRSCQVPGPDWRGLLADGLRQWRDASPADLGTPEGDPAAAREHLDRRRTLDIVTAAAFTVTVSGKAHGWPFVDGDQVVLPLDDMSACVGIVPAAGSVTLNGATATVLNVLVTYVDDGSKRIGPARLDPYRWELVSDGASWSVRSMTPAAVSQ
ncbi:SnoaL-like protein [Mycolicibacterium moriokaense]|uniref:SnoaL-like protein n=2 Tax=Mycolicibacterium moriokaense TaxID=39691 RepID=A0A318HJW7_9MYCO|nr:SnoaL-like protein [Mycolicibacterium moriokaense]